MSDSVRSPLRDHSPSTEINDKDDGLFGSDEEDAGPSKQPQDPDGNGNAREDDLFGASDEEGNDENDDEDDDEEETIKRPARQRLRVGYVFAFFPRAFSFPRFTVHVLPLHRKLPHLREGSIQQHPTRQTSMLHLSIARRLQSLPWAQEMWMI